MKCNISKKCGGCQFQGIPYKEQLKKKQKKEQSLLGAHGKVCPIIGIHIFIGIKYMQFLTVTGKEILFPVFTKKERIE